jgi:hypothetical protein
VPLCDQAVDLLDGLQSHLTEYCGTDRPHLITDVETTDAACSDQGMVARIHDRLGAQNLLPDEHLVDTGYMSAQTLLDAAGDHGVSLIGPMPPEGSWQAKAPERFDILRLHHRLAGTHRHLPDRCPGHPLASSARHSGS